jgi:primosomal protein N' (replication factor Y) (superfamily II helicase)
VTSTSQRLVEVALPLPLERNFTYAYRGAGDLKAGTRVLVSFGREDRIGWVVGDAEGPPPRGLKPILDVIESEPSVTPEILSLTRWLASYYIAPLGIALRAATPSVLTDSARHHLMLADHPPQSVTARESRFIAALRERGGQSTVRTLRRSLKMGSIWPEVRSLSAQGVVLHRAAPPKTARPKTHKVVRVTRWIEDLSEEEEMFGRARRQQELYTHLRDVGGEAELSVLLGRGFGRSLVGGLADRRLVEVVDEIVVRDPFARHDPPKAPDLTPTPRQASAISRMTAALSEGGGTFLLNGITGSGKTLVYLELIRAALAMGKTGLVLVPEISLTPQTVERFRSHFGDRIAVLHSGLSDGERYDAWRELRAGRRLVAVGARSALFAPLENLGVLVVDEEHDGSYKQSESPRYHARDLAVVRAGLENAVCVLGSATPSLESWTNAEKGKFERIDLPDRVGGGKLPPVRVIDLRETHKNSGPDVQKASFSEAGVVLAPELVGAVQERLEAREQTILLLNRRGYSAFLQCRDCGFVEECPNCSVSLTYHRGSRRLVCHHCRHDTRAPDRCVKCKSADVSYKGLGTEQVERVVAETFPQARLARMDVDTTSGKWAHHEILGRVQRGEVDVLLGTQMIAKGLDFPNVTLVGVVNADVGIHLPDFRASERTFQLLSQVAGRAGRGPKGGEVLIQTRMPDHYAVRSAVAHDYAGFAQRELAERESPRYPPYVRLVNVVLSSPDREIAVREAERAAAWMRKRIGASGQIELVGPAPSPIERLHGRWRWHFLMRSLSVRALGNMAWALWREHRVRGADVRLSIDRDPIALL